MENLNNHTKEVYKMEQKRLNCLQNKLVWTKDEVDEVLADQELSSKTPSLVIQAIGELHMEVDQYRNNRI